MKRPVPQWLFWTPRVLGILLAVFLGLAALSALWGGLGFWRTIPILLLQLIPAAVIAGVLAISWRREWVGGVVFTALGALYLAGNWRVLVWPIWLAVVGPLFLMGALFSLGWLRRPNR